MLEVSDLKAKVAGSDKSILNGVNLTIREGESHAIMGQNGSGDIRTALLLLMHIPGSQNKQCRYSL